MKIFVGNLSGETSGDDLRQAFENFGQVGSATIVIDESAGESRRFGFVRMPSASEAHNAIKRMNGRDFQGRKIDVQKARTKGKPHASRRSRSDSGNGGSLWKLRGRRYY